jgi:hypothetical protein
MSTAVAFPVRQRSLTIPVAYGPADVEHAMTTFDLALSDEEMEVILADIDSELADLAVVATRSALASRIYDDLARIARGHAWSDDD